MDTAAFAVLFPSLLLNLGFLGLARAASVRALNSCAGLTTGASIGIMGCESASGWATGAGLASARVANKSVDAAATFIAGDVFVPEGMYDLLMLARRIRL